MYAVGRKTPTFCNDSLDNMDGKLPCQKGSPQQYEGAEHCYQHWNHLQNNSFGHCKLDHFIPNKTLTDAAAVVVASVFFPALPCAKLH